MKYLIRKMISNSKKFSYEACDYGACTVIGTKANTPLPKKVFEELTLHQFEDGEFFIIQHYDEFMTSVFGDYMTPPEENKQKSHHVFKAYI